MVPLYFYLFICYWLKINGIVTFLYMTNFPLIFEVMIVNKGERGKNRRLQIEMWLFFFKYPSWLQIVNIFVWFEPGVTIQQTIYFTLERTLL